MPNTAPKQEMMTMQVRAAWKGSVNVSLVSLAVKAYSAAASEAEPVRLHQLHQDCRCRIRHQKVCPQHGPVASDQVVMGYEAAPGEHVVVDLAELDALRSRAQLRAIRIDAFVQAGEIGPFQLGDKHYYLLPDGPTAQLPYALLLTAMRSQQVQAVARVVLSKREQLVLLRPHEADLLAMSTLRYAAQVRSAELFRQQQDPLPSVPQEELALAQQLVEKRTCRPFDLSCYQDEYAAQLLKLVEAKLHGRELSAPGEQEPHPALSLMQALRQSVTESDPGAVDNGPAGRGQAGRKLSTKKPTSRRRAHKKSA